MLSKNMRYFWFSFLTAAVCALMCVLVGPSAFASDDSKDKSTRESDAVQTETTDDHNGDASASHGAHEDLGRGNAGPKLEDPSEFKADLAIYTFIVFLLLLGILGKFAWPPITKALEEREKNIAGHIAAAESKHEEAKELLEEHEKKLAGAADEVRQLLEEARRDAEQTKSQIVAEAKSAAQAEHERGMRDLDVAKDTALKQLAETSANLACDLAGTVIQEKISHEHQARVVREALSRLASIEPSAN